MILIGVDGITIIQLLPVLLQEFFKIKKEIVLKFLFIVVKITDSETGLYAKNRFSEIIKISIP